MGCGYIADMAGKDRKLLNSTAAAKVLGVNPDTLRVWANNNEGPPRIRIGKRYYYTEEIIQQWMKAMSVAS